MIRRFLFAASAALTFAGCSRSLAEPVASEDDGLYTLRVTVPAPATKSMLGADDSAIEDLQILVFDEDGLLEAYEAGPGNSHSFQCTKGVKEVVALVNAPSMQNVASYSDLVAVSSDLVGDNRPGRLVMEGKASLTVDGSQEMHTATIEVRRLATKISLGTVTLDFEAEHYNQLQFSITGVYLVNVAGEKKYLSDVAPTLWYNRMKVEDGGDVPLICDKLAPAVAVKEGTPYTAVHDFYCYPNPSPDSSEAEWSPRSTRFVVEAVLGEDTYFYPVTMPVLVQNTAYKVNLTIRRPGSLSPDVPVQTYWGEGVVTVVPWGDPVVVDKEI